MWMPYDSGWYIEIAQRGYSFTEQASAFFPAWPIIIKILASLLPFIEIRLLAFVFVQFICLAALLAFYKLVKDQFEQETAYLSVKYLLFFPTALFLGTTYTESLFLLLIFLSVIFARNRNYLAMFLVSVFVGLTRLSGSVTVILLVLIIYANEFKTRSSWWKTVFALGPLVGLGIYCLYLKLYSGDYLAFLHAQQAWNRSFGFEGFIQLFTELRNLLAFPFSGFSDVTSSMVGGSLLISGIVVLIIASKKLKADLVFYALAAIIFPLFSGSFISYNRYFLAAFPVFIALGIFANKNKNLDTLITVLFLLFQGLFIAMFTRGYWVA